MATAHETYWGDEVMSASPQKRQLMLLEGAVVFASRTIECWRRQDDNAGVANLLRSQRIMAEILTRLRYDLAPELVEQVGQVYVFIYRTLVEAHLYRDPKKVLDALRILEIERETWRQVCRQLGAKPAPEPPASERLQLDA